MEVNVRIVATLLVLTWPVVSACAASYQVFPPKVMDGVDPHLDFARWRMLPNEDGAKKVQLGGRIVEVQSDGNRVRIVVAQLPIVNRPAYGPRDTGQHKRQFVVLYSGRIGPPFLQRVIGLQLLGTRRLRRRQASKGFPRLFRQCRQNVSMSGQPTDEKEKISLTWRQST